MSDSTDISNLDRIDYAARRQSMRTQRTPRRIRWYHATAVLASVLLIAVFAETALSFAKVHPGVSVSGVEVGGMVAEKARLALESGLTARVDEPVTVKHKDQTWQITSKEVGLAFDYDALVKQAMAVGRSGGPLRITGDRLRSWISGTDIDATTSARATLVDVALDSIAAGTDVAPVDADVVIDGTEPHVVPAKNGLVLDRDAAALRITAAFLGKSRTVTAPVRTAPVAIDDADAQVAADIAKKMVSAPATVTLAKRAWTFQPKQIAQWIVFDVDASSTTTSAPADGTLRASISATKAASAVTDALGTKIGRAPVNARFKTSAGSVTIVPSKNGTGPDLEALASELSGVLADPSSKREVELRTTVTEPEITTADARKMGVKNRISVYTTTYASNNVPRVNNIHTLGDGLDGTLVAPGKVFSFNGAVGERTAAKGYQEANAIVNGKLVPQLGGGICQVGTTIFNTIFESGLPVIQRRNHSFYISHYPKGRDATISWGGPDFKFKNDTDHWVLISVSYTSSSLTIALYGTDPGYEVSDSTSDWRNIKPFPVETIKDKTMAKGSKTIEDAGVDGKTITVTRTVSKDGTVLRTDKFVSVYKPKSQTVRVGTKAQIPPAEAQTETN